MSLASRMREEFFALALIVLCGAAALALAWAHFRKLEQERGPDLDEALRRIRARRKREEAGYDD